MKEKHWWQSYTIRAALATILATWGGYFGNEVSLKPAIAATVTAILFIFLRKGAGVAIK